jgi:hypothetical protein
MKQVLIFSALVIFMTFGCKKEPEVPIFDESSHEWGEATAIRNGTDWKASCYSRSTSKYPNKFTLSLSQYNAANELRSTFNFRYMPFSTGTYYPINLHGNSVYPSDSVFTMSFNTLRADGDVAGDTYIMWHDSAVVFTVDFIDQKTKEVKGTFKAKLKKYIFPALGELDPASPDTIIFENGVYHAKIVQ